MIKNTKIRVAREEKLDSIIDLIAKMYGWEDQLLQQRAIDAYSKIVHKDLLRYTTALFFQKGTLFIRIMDAAAKNNLSYYLDALKESINHDLSRPVIEKIVLL